jgi:hypothetical protein
MGSALLLLLRAPLNRALRGPRLIEHLQQRGVEKALRNISKHPKDIRQDIHFEKSYKSGFSNLPVFGPGDNG